MDRNTESETEKWKFKVDFFSELDLCNITILLRIGVIFYITQCMHTHTDMCHMEALLARKVGTQDAHQPSGGTTGPIQMKNRTISVFPHLAVSTM